MNREKDRRKNWGPGVIFVAFIAAVATFFIMLQVEKNALRDYEKAVVWCTNTVLPAGVEITAENSAAYFVQKELNVGNVPEAVILEPAILIGQQAAIAIPKGSVLTANMFVDTQKFVEDMQEPVLAGCKADDLYQMVSGVLRKGDIVHVYAVNEELEQTYLLWENVLVYQVFDASGKAIAPEDKETPAARLNVLLEKKCAEQFYNELNNGSLRLVKACDDTVKGGL